MQTSDFMCIDDIYTDNEVDLITLKDGRVVGISCDCIVLYKDMDDFYNFDGKIKPTIQL